MPNRSVANRSVTNHLVCRARPIAVACIIVHAVLRWLSAVSTPVRVGAVRPGVSVDSAGSVWRGAREATGRQEAGAWRLRGVRPFVAAWGDRPVLLWLVSSVGRWSQHRDGTGPLRPPPGGCDDAFPACHHSRGRPGDALSSPQQPNTAYTHQLISGRDSVTKGESHRV